MIRKASKIYTENSQMFVSSPLSCTLHDKYFQSILEKFDNIQNRFLNMVEESKQKVTVSIQDKDSFLHELVYILSVILNYGIDQSTLLNSSMASPIATQPQNTTKCFYSIIASFSPLRKSVRFISTLDFVKSYRARCQLWLLLEIADGKMLEIFKIAKNAEIQVKYCQNSFMKSQYDIVIDKISEFNFDNLIISGEIIERFYQYQEFEIQDLIIEPQTMKNMTRISMINQISEENQTKTPKRFKAQQPKSPNFNDGMGIHHDQMKGSLTDDLQQDSLKQKRSVQDKIKNSTILFQNLIEKQLDETLHRRFQKKPIIASLSSQHGKCANCKTQIEKYINPFRKNTANLCNFTGNWYCEVCMNSVPIEIPWRVCNNFDFTLYPVSVIGYNYIDENKKKPVLILEYFENIVYNHQKLYNFLIQKRQLHLMYDTICQADKMQTYANKLNAKDKYHFFLTMNILSLEDFKQIKDGSILKTMQSIYNSGLKHLNECENCKKNGRQCIICKSPNKIFACDIINVVYCRTCRTLYHRECFQKAKCIVCLEKNPLQSQ